MGCGKVCLPDVESLSSMISLLSQELDMSCTTAEVLVFIFVHSSIHSVFIYPFSHYVSGIGDKQVNKSWSIPEILIDSWERQVK